GRSGCPRSPPPPGDIIVGLSGLRRRDGASSERAGEGAPRELPRARREGAGAGRRIRRRGAAVCPRWRARGRRMVQRPPGGGAASRCGARGSLSRGRRVRGAGARERGGGGRSARGASGGVSARQGNVLLDGGGGRGRGVASPRGGCST